MYVEVKGKRKKGSRNTYINGAWTTREMVVVTYSLGDCLNGSGYSIVGVIVHNADFDQYLFGNQKAITTGSSN